MERKLFFFNRFLIGFRPNLTEHSLSLFSEKFTFIAWLSSTGSAHSKSHKSPDRGGSWNRLMSLISFVSLS